MTRRMASRHRARRRAASAPAEVMATSTWSGGGTSHAVTLPSGIVAGEILLLFYRCGVVSATASTPSGWTLGGYNSTSRLYVFWKIATGSEGSTVTVTTNASSTDYVMACRIGNAQGLECSLASTTAPNHDPPALTVSWGAAPMLWITALSTIGSTAGMVVPTGYTLLVNGSGTNLPYISAYRTTEGTDTEDPGPWTTSTVVVGSAATVGIRPL
jgi:hypothetical protein